MPIQCEIVTQDRALFEGKADLVIAPGAEGELGILPNHAPLLTALGVGVLTVRYRGDEQFFTIAGGILEVRPELVTVLADVGENIAEIDVDRAEAAKVRAEEYLKKGPPPDTDEYLMIQASLQRSRIRLDAVRRFRQRQQPQQRASSEEGS